MNPFKSKSQIRKSTITITSLLLTPRQKCNKSVQLGEVKKRKRFNSIKCGHEELNSNSPSSTNNVSLNNTTESPVSNNDSILKIVLSYNNQP